MTRVSAVVPGAGSAVCAAFVLAGCGSAPARESNVVGEREWRANTVIIVRQLQSDIASTQISGGTRAAAQAALRDESSLYGLLVAYSDFAGCRGMVAAAGEAPEAGAKAERLLAAGCRHLERASASFTRAVKENDGAALLAADREAGRALPWLVKAAAALKAHR